MQITTPPPPLKKKKLFYALPEHPTSHSLSLSLRVPYEIPIVLQGLHIPFRIPLRRRRFDVCEIPWTVAEQGFLIGRSVVGVEVWQKHTLLLGALGKGSDEAVDNSSGMVSVAWVRNCHEDIDP